MSNSQYVKCIHGTLVHLHFHALQVAKWETPRFQPLGFPSRTRPVVTAREETAHQVALWRKYLIAREQGLGATVALDVDTIQTRARKTFELLRSAPPTQCVDALLILGVAAVVASWDASERGDTDGAWLNLLAAEHAEGQIQGILIVAENSTLSGSLQRKKSSAKSKTDYARLLARARAIKAQKPKFSRPQIANFLSKYGADGNAKAVGGEFDLKPATILKRLQGLDLIDK